MFLKRLLSNSLIYAVGPQIPRIAGLFILPIITQFLTPEDFGIYGITTSYVGLFSAAGDLGISILLVNSFYRFPTRWRIIWRQLHFYLWCWSLLYGLALAMCLYVIIPANAFENRTLIILTTCLPLILFNPTILMGTSYYQFSQRPLYAGIVTAVVGTLTIVLNLYTIAYLKMGYAGWFLSTATASTLQFVLFFFPVFIKHKLAPLIAFRPSFLLRHLKVSLPTVPHNYSAYLLNSSDRVVMERQHVNVGDIGRYNVAYTFGNYFEFFGNAVGMALGPAYLALFAKKDPAADRDVHFLTNWLQVSFIVLGCTIALWSRELMEFLIRDNELRQTYPVAIIIVMGYVYRPYYWVSVNKLQFDEKTSQLWKISFVAGVVNVALNVALIPFFGIMAAAVVTFAALMYMGFSGHFLRSSTLKGYQPVQMIFLILALTAVIYSARDVAVMIKFLVTAFSIVTYAAYYWSQRQRFLKISL